MSKKYRVFSSFESFSKSDIFMAIPESETILLVTGKKSFVLSGAAQRVEEFLGTRRLLFFQDFSINPKIEDAIRGAEIAFKHDIKHVIAIGGGSVIDMAKLIIAMYGRHEHAESIVRGSEIIKDNDLSLSCVPTTSSSGSECTHFAVAYIGSEKFSVASEILYANNIVLCPELTSSNTPYQKAVNALDALSHAIESAWAISSTSESRQNSFAAIDLLMRWLPSISNHSSPKALKELMLAAHLAGKAIDVTKTTSPHAFSYGFTSQHGVPHGHAVWLTLPEVFQAHLECVDEAISDPRGVNFFRKNIQTIVRALGLQPSGINTQLVDFLTQLNVEPDMTKLGATLISQRKKIAGMVNVERLKNNPVDLNKQTIEKIFEF